MPALDDHKRKRVIAVIAATVISLACGTNYVYSAWAPQFASRLKLSSTQTNLVGTMGNLGMYASGIPFGMLIDAKGPRWGVGCGILLFMAGYAPIAKAYNAGPGVYSLPSLCLFSFFTGAGSCAAFSGSIKSAATNFPDHRGTATAFPLSAFGLSAFFFATLALALPNDTSNFLTLLASGTVVLPTVSIFFLNTVTGITGGTPKDVDREEQRLHYRTKSAESRGTRKGHVRNLTTEYISQDAPSNSEDASLLSKPDTPTEQKSFHNHQTSRIDESAVDVRGLALLKLPTFYQLFLLLGILTGIGLMTINNIGNIAQSLWIHSSPSNPPTSDFIARRQVLHVSVLSIFSFTGRLTSGIGSDVLVRRYNASRFWCLFASAVLFLAAQTAALLIEDPTHLLAVSALTGLAYGTLFGVYPSLVAYAFGNAGLSQNWGTMTLAPVIFGNLFNLVYGRVFDGNSTKDDKTGDYVCSKGKVCYTSAYWMTLAASVISVGLVLWSVRHERKEEGKVGRRRDKSVGGEDDDDDDNAED